MAGQELPDAAVDVHGVDRVAGDHHPQAGLPEQLPQGIVLSEEILYGVQAAQRIEVPLPHQHRFADHARQPAHAGPR